MQHFKGPGQAVPKVEVGGAVFHATHPFGANLYAEEARRGVVSKSFAWICKRERMLARAIIERSFTLHWE